MMCEVSRMITGMTDLQVAVNNNASHFKLFLKRTSIPTKPQEVIVVFTIKAV